ncbi:MAG: hypothetical protein KatS3mg052_2599 [Candidatus Roseilinea sp.]|nr:MAG: hypothetical protein KatS3mg052_2599 [Candidatus Roseilinea sp.]
MTLSAQRAAAQRGCVRRVHRHADRATHIERGRIRRGDRSAHRHLCRAGCAGASAAQRRSSPRRTARVTVGSTPIRSPQPPRRTVQLRVQLRCGGPPAPLQGTIHYESLCSNNDTYYERCNAGGTLAAPLRLAPLPLLTKFPERIYATGDVVTWTLIAKNTGAGPAYSLVLTDALGSGLRFVTRQHHLVVGVGGRHHPHHLHKSGHLGSAGHSAQRGAHHQIRSRDHRMRRPDQPFLRRAGLLGSSLFGGAGRSRRWSSCRPRCC